MKNIHTRKLRNTAFALTILTLSTFSVESVQAEVIRGDEQVKTAQVSGVETPAISSDTQVEEQESFTNEPTETVAEGDQVIDEVQEEAISVEQAPDVQVASVQAENVQPAVQTEPTTGNQETEAVATNEEVVETQVESVQSPLDTSPVHDNEFTYAELEEAGQLYVDEDTPTEGRWVSGEVHAHTNVSGDASEPYMVYENIVNAAFREDVDEIPEEGRPSLNEGEAFDYFMTADHLRDSPRDVNGVEVETATWEKIWQQVDKFNALKAEGKYDGKIYYPGFEWDMFGLDHASVAIIEEGTNRVPIDAYHEFEWLFSYDTRDEMFYSNEEEVYGPRQNEKEDKENSFRALAWLQENYPKSILIVNHPSRHAGSGSGEVHVEDLRRMQDTAPTVVIGFEGMPGNQMGGDRGEMTDIYGGADVMLAEVGGVWDSLLGEGRHFFNLTNSDFHFKISSNELYSSGYWPSEYSRNYTWVENNTFEDMAEGLRSGNSFSVFGDLITALDFKIIQDGKEGVMGSDFEAVEGEEATLVMRFRESDLNNYQPITSNDGTVTNNPSVDHIDLISGLITGPVSDPTIDNNPTTEVVATFDKADWGEPDENGFYTVTYDFVVDNDRYFRLRGTNLPANTPGETDAFGNPLLDEAWSMSREDYGSDEEYIAARQEFYNAVNNRNYRDLWFYSNPIFMYAVEDEVTVEDLENKVSDLENAVGDLEENNADLKDQIAALEAELQAVKEKIANAEDSVEALENRVVELENKLNAAKEENAQDNNNGVENKDDDTTEDKVNESIVDVDSDSDSDDEMPTKVSSEEETKSKPTEKPETEVNSASVLPETGSAVSGLSGIVGLILSGLGLSLFKRKKD